MKRALLFLTIALCTLAGCASSGAGANWSMIEGCWIDSSDAIPAASMIWRPDAMRPGAYLGAWRVPGPYEDSVDFELAPDGEGMRLCQRAPGAALHCANAVLAPAATATVNADAVFEVSATDLAFGYADRPAPFYIGRRGLCADANN